ncbi:MAG: hypothetical protein HC836_34650 [Richelia sp. RM2_1_2]|nr:hypothetical protein [Richelia sp. RM2_1_2]
METETSQTETFHCIVCQQDKPVNKAGGTGYGRNKDGKTCYACIGILDKQALENAKIGDKFTHYLAKKKGEDYYTVCNWPGTWSTGKLYVRKGYHNIARYRYDVWFTVGKNRFHGVTFGDMTQICHIRCIKPS